MRSRRIVTALKLLLGGAAAGIWLCTVVPVGMTASAQTVGGQGGASVAQQIADARKALAAGQHAEALKAVDAAIGRAPGNREAARLKIDILLAGQQVNPALEAYDAYVSAARAPDQEMLAIIGFADLRRVVVERQNDRMLVVASLERLSRGGDADAMGALKQMAGSVTTTAEGLSAAVSLAKLGDAQARASLGKLLDTSMPDDRLLLIKTIQDAGATAQAASVAARLDDADPGVRSAAATAVGVLQYKPAIPRLQSMLQGDLSIVRMYVAFALKRLGDSSADAAVAQFLTSQIPEVRLAAAEAFQGTHSQEWLSLVSSLRQDRSDATRIRAAALMACCDREAARATLLQAFNSSIPLVRLEAARALEDKGLGDAALARRMLSDTFDPVRVSGAGIAIALWRGVR